MGISSAAVLSFLGADTAAAAGTAAAADAGAAALTGEVVATAPAIASGIGAADVLGAGAAGLGAAASGGAFGGTGGASGAPATTIPSSLVQPVSTATPSPITQALSPSSGSTGNPSGGPGASAATGVPPASVSNAPSSVPSFAGSNFTPSSVSPITASPFNTTPLDTNALSAAGQVGDVGGGASAAAGGSNITVSQAPNSISTAWDNPTGGNILKALGGNAGSLISGGALAADLLKGNSPPAGLNQISNTASQLSGQATQLENYLTTGTLPPGVQNSLNTAADQAKASIRSQYASRGMTGSSAEAQDLAGVDNTISAQGTNIALQLLNQGVSEANLSSQLYTTIMNESLNQDAQLGSAVASFASALAGSQGNGQTLTIKAA